MYAQSWAWGTLPCKNQSLAFRLMVLTCLLVAPRRQPSPGRVATRCQCRRFTTSFRPSVVDVISDDDVSYGIGIGYAFNRHFSVEGGYHDFGEPIGFAGCPIDVLCIQAFVPEAVSIEGWSASLVVTTSLTEQLSIRENWLHVVGRRCTKSILERFGQRPAVAGLERISDGACASQKKSIDMQTNLGVIDSGQTANLSLRVFDSSTIKVPFTGPLVFLAECGRGFRTTCCKFFQKRAP